jgi:hypothetical protein
MSAALDAGKKYLADLAAGRVVYREKPTAFQHGLIESLVADLEKANEQLARLFSSKDSGAK